MRVNSSSLLQWVVTGFLVAIVASSHCAAQTEQEEPVKVFSFVSPSVVEIHSLTGSGTGFVLNSDGLILTNAHVIVSPVRFRAKMDIERNGKLESVEFKDVQILAMHPTKDMALVKVDLAQHPGAKVRPVRISKAKATPGQRIYAIGNPSNHGVSLTRTITAGLLSGVDRRLENVNYYQISAAVNPGNSGGPLVDRDGTVLGMVTLKMQDSENVGFAIPMSDLDLSEFGPPRRTKVDKVKSAEMLKLASKLLDKYGEYEKRKEKDKPEAKLLRFIITQTYQEAMMYDPTDARTYYMMGAMLQGYEEYEAAEAFLLEALELDPNGGGGATYRWLGLVLATSKKADDALIVDLEAVAKHPISASQVWEDMAILHRDRGQWMDAAHCAAVALQLSQMGRPNVRPDFANALLRLCKSKVPPADVPKIDAFVADAAEELKKREEQALVHRQARKPIITVEFEKWLEARNRTLGRKGASAVAVARLSNAALPAFVEPGTPAPTGLIGATTKPPMPSGVPPTATSTTPAPKSPPGAGALLAGLDLSRQSVRGSWTLQDGVLTASSGAKSRLEFPNELPQEYDFECTLTRTGSGQVVIGFVREGIQSMLYFDRANKDSGLSGIATPLFTKQLLKSTQPVQLKLEVRRTGVACYANGALAFKRESNGDFPKVPLEWAVRNRFALFVGSDQCAIRVENPTLTGK